MQKTKKHVLAEVEVLITNYWSEIKTAYEKSGGVNLTIKVGIEPQGEQVGVTPTIEFYPLPKTKSEWFTVLIDENQLKLTGM